MARSLFGVLRYLRCAHEFDEARRHCVITARLPRQPDLPTRGCIAQGEHPGIAQKILRPGRQECSADACGDSGKNRLDIVGLLNHPRHETVLTAPAIDLRGQPDLFGRTLEVSIIGFADEIAAAASLLQGQAAEGQPVIVVRGLTWTAPNASIAELLRPPEEDLFL